MGVESNTEGPSQMGGPGRGPVPSLVPTPDPQRPGRVPGTTPSSWGFERGLRVLGWVVPTRRGRGVVGSMTGVEGKRGRQERLGGRFAGPDPHPSPQNIVGPSPCPLIFMSNVPFRGGEGRPGLPE